MEAKEQESGKRCAWGTGGRDTGRYASALGKRSPREMQPFVQHVVCKLAAVEERLFLTRWHKGERPAGPCFRSIHLIL